MQARRVIFLSLILLLSLIVLFLTPTAAGTREWLFVESPSRVNVNNNALVLTEQSRTSYGLFTYCQEDAVSRRCRYIEYGNNPTFKVLPGGSCTRHQPSLNDRFRTSAAFLLLAFFVVIPLVVINGLVLFMAMKGHEYKIQFGEKPILEGRMLLGLIRIITTVVSLFFLMVAVCVYGHTIRYWVNCGSHYCDAVRDLLANQNTTTAQSSLPVSRDYVLNCGYGYSMALSIASCLFLLAIAVLLAVDMVAERNVREVPKEIDKLEIAEEDGQNNDHDDDAAVKGTEEDNACQQDDREVQEGSNGEGGVSPQQQQRDLQFEGEEEGEGGGEEHHQQQRDGHKEEDSPEPVAQQPRQGEEQPATQRDVQPIENKRETPVDDGAPPPQQPFTRREERQYRAQEEEPREAQRRQQQQPQTQQQRQQQQTLPLSPIRPAPQSEYSEVDYYASSTTSAAQPPQGNQRQKQRPFSEPTALHQQQEPEVSAVYEERSVHDTWGTPNGGPTTNTTVLLPEGDDWEYDGEEDLYWSDANALFFDHRSGHFFDPASGNWFDPGRNLWYTMPE